MTTRLFRDLKVNPIVLVGVFFWITHVMILETPCAAAVMAALDGFGAAGADIVNFPVTK